MKRIPLILLTVSLIGFYSCRTNETKTKATKAERVIVKKTDTQVKVDMDSLLRGIDASWNRMIASDDQKIDDLNTLLAKVGHTKNHDKKALADLISTGETMKTKRYDRIGIEDVAAVDAYDSLQIKVLDETNALIQASNLTSRDTLAARLANEVQEEDTRVPIMRAYYDKAAKAYNQYLSDYKPQLLKLGQPYNALKPLPLFVPNGVL